MSNQIDDYRESVFESLKKINEAGNEYWLARDLAKALEYTDWRNFVKVVRKAMLACSKSGAEVENQFIETSATIDLGKGVKRNVSDYMLSRYASYLIVQNGDPSKELIPQGQTYFAVKTHQQEMSEDRAQFQDAGYTGLYSGLDNRDIHKRKGLKPNQSILDHMDSEELAANYFRITQTEAKLKREGITGQEAADEAHHAVGKKVRQTIEELGGTMPENLPTPSKSIQQIEGEVRKRKTHKSQLPPE
jgi:DNA-damage-inducible protein D